MKKLIKLNIVILINFNVMISSLIQAQENDDSKFKSLGLATYLSFTKISAENTFMNSMAYFKEKINAKTADSIKWKKFEKEQIRKYQNLERDYNSFIFGLTYLMLKDGSSKSANAIDKKLYKNKAIKDIRLNKLNNLLNDISGDLKSLSVSEISNSNPTTAAIDPTSFLPGFSDLAGLFSNFLTYQKEKAGSVAGLLEKLMLRSIQELVKPEEKDK